MQPRHALLIVLTTTLLLGLATASLSFNACSLISQAEAEKVLGEAVAPARHSNVVGIAAGVTCAYYTAAPIAKRGGTGVLQVTVYDPGTMAAKGIVYQSPTKYFQRHRQVLAKRGKGQKVDGLPCEAFWLSGSDTLHLLSHNHYVVIKVRDITKMQAPNSQELDRKLSAHRLQKSKQVALQYVLPRLPK